MVDYSAALPQLQPYQAPNMLAMAQQAQQMQIGNVLMQEKQRGLEESNALRGLISQGVDPTTIEGQRALVSAAPNAGPALVKSYIDINAAKNASNVSAADLAAKQTEMFRNILPTIKDQTGYDAWRSMAVKVHPAWESTLPPDYSPDNVSNIMQTADKALAAHKTEAYTEEATGRRFQPEVDSLGRIINQREVTPGAVAAPTQVASLGAPGSNAAVDQRLIKSEGLGQNPTSTAQGIGQIIDPTFISAFKQMHPEAKGMSDADILAQRSNATQAAMVPFLTNQYRGALASANLPDTPGNIKLMHFLGQPTATALLQANPTAPIASIVSPQAIAANQSILGGAKTVGDITNWAQANMGGAPVPANNLAAAVAPPVANALVTPSTIPAAAAVNSITAGMTPRARADYENTVAKKAAELQSADVATKDSRRQVGEYLQTMIGGEAGKKIEGLINNSTSGTAQNIGAAAVSGLTGSSTPGMKNSAALAVIADNITRDIFGGKLGAGVSDADRGLVERLNGKIGDANLPADQRLMAFKQFQNIVDSWATGKELKIEVPAVATDNNGPATLRGRRGTVGAAAASTTLPSGWTMKVVE